MSSVAEQIAKATWQRLKQAGRHRVRLGEETLTDLLTLELVRSEPNNYKLLQTTKSDEATYGTDLELHIRVGKRTTFVAAIQAKKLYHSGRYDSLNAKAGSTQCRQIDVLEKYALKAQASPVYLLYNHVDTFDRNAHWHCCRTFDEVQLGCTLVPSSLIRRVLSPPTGRRKFDWLHRHDQAVPWRCLFDCPKMPHNRAREGNMEMRTRFLQMLAESVLARERAWPDWLWRRGGDAPMLEEELTELHGGPVHLDDSNPDGETDLPIAPLRLIPRRVLLVDDRERP